MSTITFDFSGKSVAITGAANGIGLAIARHFADSGAAVWALDADPAALDKACSGTDGIAGLVCNVADATSVAAAFDTMSAQQGPDILVNNAGILRDGVLWKTTDEGWAAVLAVHLTGTFNCTRAAVPTMRAKGAGRVINTTSYTGLHGNVGQANYAAAKAGIIGFTRTAAKELAHFGITVNAISPNASTAMVESIPPDKRSGIQAQIPLGRFAEPKEMAPAVAFLASEEAAYITGVVLPVDGGLSI